MIGRLLFSFTWLLLPVLSGCYGSSEIQTESNALSCKGPRDPGQVTLHRLNRSEYDNTVRDLLGDTTAPAQAFPPDDTGYGFDNNADVLAMAPVLFEKYDLAAELLVSKALTPGSAQAGKIRLCDPSALGVSPCARKILARFARKAWRRPVAEEEVTRLEALVNLAIENGDDFTVGLKWALHAVLLSPHFLYRVELDALPNAEVAHSLSPHELASRMSYFLWSSMPDEALLAKADDGTLSAPAVAEAEARRMLKDARAEALVKNFGGQWLYTRGIVNAHPDPTLFPDVTDALKKSMQDQTEALFRAFLIEDRSALDLVDADFTFLNQDLASHYGLPEMISGVLSRTAVAPSQGPGLLGQAGLLMLTSNSDRTSPVKRGKWVSSQLLCKEPPPPPPMVEGIQPDLGSGLSLRAQMEEHRRNPTCAGCHAMMDPIGFGLENFDAVGRWRTEDAAGFTIDASGTLPSGRNFVGPRELAQALKADPALSECMAEKVLLYALGRGLTDADACAIQELTARFAEKKHRLSELLINTVMSQPFQRRRGLGPEGATK